MSKVTGSAHPSPTAEAQELLGRHNQAQDAWISARKEHPNAVLEIRYPGKPPVRVDDPFKFDMTMLKGASGYVIVEASARSDGRGGVTGGTPISEGRFENRLPAATKQVPAHLRRSGRLGGPRPNVSAVPKNQPGRATSKPFGPFASKAESMSAQRALTRTGYGAVATNDGSWGPKSDKAMQAFAIK